MEEPVCQKNGETRFQPVVAEDLRHREREVPAGQQRVRHGIFAFHYCPVSVYPALRKRTACDAVRFFVRYEVRLPSFAVQITIPETRASMITDTSGYPISSRPRFIVPEEDAILGPTMVLALSMTRE